MSAATGCVTHYWGRRLPDRWHWISADAFTTPDGSRHPDLALEAVLLALQVRQLGLGPDDVVAQPVDEAVEPGDLRQLGQRATANLPL